MGVKSRTWSIFDNINFGEQVTLRGVVIESQVLEGVINLWHEIERLRSNLATARAWGKACTESNKALRDKNAVLEEENALFKTTNLKLGEEMQKKQPDGQLVKFVKHDAEDFLQITELQERIKNMEIVNGRQSDTIKEYQHVVENVSKALDAKVVI